MSEQRRRPRADGIGGALGTPRLPPLCYGAAMPALAAKRSALLVDHPAWQAAQKAPLQLETDEEREAVAEAMRSEKLIQGAAVSAEIARRIRR